MQVVATCGFVKHSCKMIHFQNFWKPIKWRHYWVCFLTFFIQGISIINSIVSPNCLKMKYGNISVQVLKSNIFIHSEVFLYYFFIYFHCLQIHLNSIIYLTFREHKKECLMFHVPCHQCQIYKKLAVTDPLCWVISNLMQRLPSASFPGSYLPTPFNLNVVVFIFLCETVIVWK